MFSVYLALFAYRYPTPMACASSFDQGVMSPKAVRYRHCFFKKHLASDIFGLTPEQCFTRLQNGMRAAYWLYLVLPWIPLLSSSPVRRYDGLRTLAWVGCKTVGASGAAVGTMASPIGMTIGGIGGCIIGGYAGYQTGTAIGSTVYD